MMMMMMDSNNMFQLMQLSENQAAATEQQAEPQGWRDRVVNFFNTNILRRGPAAKPAPAPVVAQPAVVAQPQQVQVMLI